MKGTGKDVSLGLSSYEKGEMSNNTTHDQSMLEIPAERHMTPEECPRFNLCGAALCPLSSEDFVWYSDEEICKLSDFQDTTLIRTQKKIQRRRASGVFTKAMLDRKIIVGKNIKGLHADEVDRKAEDTWIQKHKEFLKVITDEQKRMMVSRLRSPDAHSKRSPPRSVGSVDP